MAKRPVFMPSERANLVEAPLVDFTWFPGHAVSQKQRSITALHDSARQFLGIDRLLEVSTKSPDPLGASLSAFRLRLTSDTLGRSLTVEAAFQGSKVFAKAGQLVDLYSQDDGRVIKRRISQLAADRVVGFEFEGRSWPLEPRTAFYDWLYMRALREQVRVAETVAGSWDESERFLSFEGFTDIEFNPERSINCQARSCALYIALARRDALEVVDSEEDYLLLVGGEPSVPVVTPQALFEE